MSPSSVGALIEVVRMVPLDPWPTPSARAALRDMPNKGIRLTLRAPAAGAPAAEPAPVSEVRPEV